MHFEHPAFVLSSPPDYCFISYFRSNCLCISTLLFVDASDFTTLWKSLSSVRLFATPWTIQSREFSRPEYQSGWPFLSPGDLPNPGIERRSPALDSLPAELPGKPHYERFLPPSSFNLLTSSGSDRLLPLLCLPFPCFTVSICCLFILPTEVPLGFVVKLVWCRILLNFSFDFSIKSEHEPLWVFLVASFPLSSP